MKVEFQEATLKAHLVLLHPGLVVVYDQCLALPVLA